MLSAISLLISQAAVIFLMWQGMRHRPRPKKRRSNAARFRVLPVRHLGATPAGWWLYQKRDIGGIGDIGVLGPRIGDF